MKRKNIIPKIKVIIERTLSEPLSLVFAKIFILLPPVIAPEAPFVFPPCNRVIKINITEMTS